MSRGNQRRRSKSSLASHKFMQANVVPCPHGAGDPSRDNLTASLLNRNGLVNRAARRSFAAFKRKELK